MSLLDLPEIQRIPPEKKIRHVSACFRPHFSPRSGTRVSMEVCKLVGKLVYNLFTRLTPPKFNIDPEK